MKPKISTEDWWNSLSEKDKTEIIVALRLYKFLQWQDAVDLPFGDLPYSYTKRITSYHKGE